MNNVFIWTKERCFIVVNTYRVFLHDPRGSGTRANRRFGLTGVFSSFRSIRAVSLLIVLCNGPAACAPSPLLIGAGLECRRLCAVNARQSLTRKRQRRFTRDERPPSFSFFFLFFFLPHFMSRLITSMGWKNRVEITRNQETTNFSCAYSTMLSRKGVSTTFA